MAMDYEAMTDEKLLELAQHYFNGTDDFEQDPEEGAYIVKIAADRGNADALCEYGTCLLNGTGVPKDDKAALQYWEQSAEKGCALATYKIAVCHLNGLCGLEKDPSKGAVLLDKAAQLGDADAMFRLALLYENGVGVPKDSGKADEYVRSAAKQDHPIACFFLGMKIMSGAGEDREKIAQAVQLIGFAAESGEAQAQFVYGSLFQNGQGVEKDLAQAAGWYRRSAKAGFPPANQALMQLGFPGVQ